MKGNLGMGGSVGLRRIPAQHIHRAASIRLPGGRLLLTRDRGDSRLLGEHQMISNLSLIHCGPDGVVKDVRDLGSGLVTNAGVNLMSNDYVWAAGATLKQMNQHAIGTGTTSATASDVFLQTPQGATNLSGTTNGYMAGTQSVIANATGSPYSPVYQTVATFTATGSIAVTEWIVAMSNAAVVTGTATAASSTSLTDSAASFTTAGNGVQGFSVETSGSSITAPTNGSPTTQPMGQILSNTGTVLTLLQNAWASGTKSWLSLTNQAVSTPSGTSHYIVFPTALDHKVFSAVNLSSGDTLQVAYQLSLNSGG